MIVAVAVFGTIFGSFINALSYRWGVTSVLRGRSRCMHCGHGLGVLDLVPVFSYLFIRGRCRYCGTRISTQYPLVEVVAGALAVGTYHLHPELVQFFYFLLIWMALLFIVVYDVRHRIIPFSASLLLLPLTLGSLFLPELPPTSMQLLAGPLLAFPLFVLCAVSQGRWMGWGDPLLQLSLGWLVGFWSGLSGLFIAFVSGAIVGIALIVLQKRYTMNSEIPFAPFLVLGAAVAYFFNVDFFSHFSVLF